MMNLHSTVVLLKVRYSLYSTLSMNEFTFYCSSIKGQSNLGQLEETLKIYILL